MTTPAQQLEAGLLTLGLVVSALQQEKLLRYLELLSKWNSAFNLTAVRDPHAMVSRLLLDSLTLAPFINADSILDVGSGAGLPGVPLAILYPHKQFVLLDSNGKKTRFLFQVKLALSLDNLDVENNRIEHYQSTRQIDIVTCRAFSSLAGTVELLGPLLSNSTRLLAMKGEDPEQEIADLPAGYTVSRIIPVTVPDIDVVRHIIEIRSTQSESTGGALTDKATDLE